MAADKTSAPIEIDFGTIDLNDVVSRPESSSSEMADEMEKTVVNRPREEQVSVLQQGPAPLLDLAVSIANAVQSASSENNKFDDLRGETKIADPGLLKDSSDNTKQIVLTISTEPAISPAPPVPELMLSVLPPEALQPLPAPADALALTDNKSTQIVNESTSAVEVSMASTHVMGSLETQQIAQTTHAPSVASKEPQETVVANKTSAPNSPQADVCSEPKSSPVKKDPPVKNEFFENDFEEKEVLSKPVSRVAIMKIVAVAVLSLGGIAAYFGGDEGGFLGEPSAEVSPPVSISPKLAAKPVKPLKPSKGIKQLSAKTGSSLTVSEEAGDQKTADDVLEHAVRDLSKSKNGSHFEALEKRISQGDAFGAIERFRMHLSSPMDETDKVVAAELTARYYLLVGVPQRAIEPLEPLCDANPDINPMTCIHYLRALVSSGKWKSAKSFLGVIGESSSFSHYRDQIEFSRLTVDALSSPSPSRLSNLFDSYVSWRGSDPEWQRQRSHWLTSALLELPRKERHAILKSFLEMKRDSLIAFFKHSDAIGTIGTDPVLISFLNAQSALLEIRPIGLSSKRELWESAASRVGAVLGLIEMSMTESSRAISGIVQSFLRWPLFSEVGKIVVANVNLNSGNVQAACYAWEDEASKVRAGRSKFAYDWTLVGARCAAVAGNPDAARVMQKELTAFEQAYPSVKSDFHYWILLSKLQRLQRKWDDNVIEMARGMAVTDQDRGLLAVEEARRLLAMEKPKDAASHMLSAIQKIPNHGALLQAGTEILPRAGLSPQKIIDHHARIPMRYGYRDFEHPALSEVAMKQLLLEM